MSRALLVAPVIVACLAAGSPCPRGGRHQVSPLCELMSEPNVETLQARASSCSSTVGPATACLHNEMPTVTAAIYAVFVTFEVRAARTGQPAWGGGPRGHRAGRRQRSPARSAGIRMIMSNRPARHCS
jgi:hypothetical protein